MSLHNQSREPIHIGILMGQIVQDLGLQKPEVTVQPELDLSDSETTRREYETGKIRVPRRKWSTLKKRVRA